LAKSDIRADTGSTACSSVQGIGLLSLAGMPPAKNIKVTALVGGQK
jgi:hypothetical protein